MTARRTSGCVHRLRTCGTSPFSEGRRSRSRRASTSRAYQSVGVTERRPRIAPLTRITLPAQSLLRYRSGRGRCRRGYKRRRLFERRLADLPATGHLADGNPSSHRCTFNSRSSRAAASSGFGERAAGCAAARLPVGRVHARDEHADPHLAFSLLHDDLTASCDRRRMNVALRATVYVLFH
jgi:hypothetical protein